MFQERGVCVGRRRGAEIPRLGDGGGAGAGAGRVGRVQPGGGHQEAGQEGGGGQGQGHGGL